MPQPTDIPSNVHDLAARLSVPRPMRRGSLSERFVKCSKPSCRCASHPAARHGPYYSLTSAAVGPLHSRWIPAKQVSRVRQQIEAGAQFRKDLEAYWGACERWANAELQATTASVEESAKKNVSKRPSPKSSSKRSKPS